MIANERKENLKNKNRILSDKDVKNDNKKSKKNNNNNNNGNMTEIVAAAHPAKLDTKNRELIINVSGSNITNTTHGTITTLTTHGTLTLGGSGMIGGRPRNLSDSATESYQPSATGSVMIPPPTTHTAAVIGSYSHKKIGKQFNNNHGTNANANINAIRPNSNDIGKMGWDFLRGWRLEVVGGWWLLVVGGWWLVGGWEGCV